MTNSLPHIRPPMEKQNSLSLTQGRKSAEADTFAAMLHKETKGAPDPAQPAAASPGTEKTTPQKDAATSEKSTDAPATAQTTARMDLPGIPLHGRGVTPFHRSALAGRSPSEVMQGQLFSNASLDIKQTQTLEGLMQTLGNGGDSPLASAQNFNIARQLPGLSLSMRDQNVIRELSSDDYVRTHNPSDAASARAKRRTARKRQGRHAAYGNEEIGSLSARFESGKAGISAIGYDSKGGTSYGKYQIASRVGSMDAFLGSLQESFIRESHYDPAVAGITERTRLNMDELSPIMREVIWSTAVQHGPRGAVRIFEQADAATSGSGKKYERSLISHVYDIRSGQFGGHSEGIRASVQSRFKEEEAIALNMLDGAGPRTA